MRISLTMALLIAGAALGRADTLVRIAGGGEKENNVPATQAKLYQPFGIDFDKAGNYYLVELTGHRVLKVDPKGTLTVIGGTGKKGKTGDGGPALDATFNGMHALAIGTDDALYLADTWNMRVRRLDPAAGKLAAFAGSGMKERVPDNMLASHAPLGGIYCIAFNPDRSRLYLVDLDQRQVHFVDMQTQRITRVAGNGDKGVPKDGSDARTSPLVDPRAVAADRKGNVYILERGGNALRVVDADGKIRTVVNASGKAGLSGDGGPALDATMRGPKHLCIDLDDSVLIADTANHVVRRYSPRDGTIVRIAGTGKKGASGDGGAPLSVSFNEPHGVYVHANGTLYIVDSMNDRVFRMEK